MKVKNVTDRAKKVLSKVGKLPGARKVAAGLRRRVGAAVDKVVDAMPLPVDAAVRAGRKTVERRPVASRPAKLTQVGLSPEKSGERRAPTRLAAKRVTETPKRAAPSGPKTKRGQKHR